MRWKEIIINTNTEGSELIADAFFSIGCNGVVILDKNDIAEMIRNNNLWDYADEELLQNSEETVKVISYVSLEELDNKLKELHSIIDKYDFTKEILLKDVDDENWYENWKKYYSPIETKDIVIIPKWYKYDNIENKTEIYIDPGMAFGTGEHESTRLCIELMSEIDFNNKSVIDVGTGSGILGIGAIKKGCESCYMCDIDSIAIKAARENAELNNVENKAEIELSDLLDKKLKKADIILANLTADILIRLSKDIKNHIEKDGYIVCSGIIHNRKNEVINAFKAQGFSLIKAIEMGEWNGLLFRR